MRKLAVNLAMATYTPINFFMDLTLAEFFEVANEVQEVNNSNGK